ncbi:MAG: PEFG-CTERM sorting domain-containing protein [Nitrosopumilaceae archaeon]|jgi:predicted secreted protein with PEFG-CTERM motif
MNTMKTCSLFVLLAITVGIIAVTPAYADHTTASVSIPQGTSVPGCEETNECYIPYDVTIDVGGEVTWSNDDTAAHTVTSGTPSDGPDGLFDSSLFMAGTTFSVKFEGFEPGSYDYFCMVHPWMQGIVSVQAAEAEGETHEDEHEDEKMHVDEEMHMEGAASATGMMSDGTKVSVWASKPMAGERMDISIEFENSEHVNHDIMVTQNGETVLDDTGAHHHDGKGAHETAPLSSSDPVDIKITFQGYGIDDPKTGPIGEDVQFSNVVPEFGTIAMMILGVSIVSIVAFTSKSRVIPRL